MWPTHREKCHPAVGVTCIVHFAYCSVFQLTRVCGSPSLKSSSTNRSTGGKYEHMPFYTCLNWSCKNLACPRRYILDVECIEIAI